MADEIKKDALFRVKDLSKIYPIDMGFMKKPAPLVAVNQVTFDIKEGETLGVVGESGCGKSTTGRLLTKLISSTSGSIEYRGKDITNLTEEEFKHYRAEMQFIFQDPYASLDPRYRVLNAIAEPLEVHGKVSSKQEKEEKVRELLTAVGLTEEAMKKFPHEFSGGQRQRICIARALALQPKFIVADEPVSALDVSVQAQVINLMLDMKERFGFTYMFISHDIGVVRYVCQRIIVMYLGSIVEIADKDELFENPMHPYTRALLAAVPSIDRKMGKLVVSGEVPSPINPPSGCVFHPRCPNAKPECAQCKPPVTVTENGHQVSCWLYTN